MPALMCRWTAEQMQYYLWHLTRSLLFANGDIQVVAGALIASQGMARLCIGAFGRLCHRQAPYKNQVLRNISRERAVLVGQN